LEESRLVLHRENSQTAAVLEGGRVLGTVALGDIEKLLSTRYGFSLYSSQLVLEAMRLPPLQLVVGQELTSILEQVMMRPALAFHEDVLLVDRENHFCGFIAVHSFVQIQHHLLQEQMEELIKTRDRVMEADRAKTEFLANMSHEIRTPMNGVIGAANLLLTTEVTQEQRDLVQILSQSSELLLTVINTILDFSKIENGHLELESVIFDLRECLGSSLALHQSGAARKGLSLNSEVDRDVPQYVVGDPVRFKQILLNLIGNAIKFTATGGVDVRVKMSRPASGSRLHVEVSDTGIGIPEWVQERLFKPFVQGDASTTRRYGGTGLGLAICSSLVKLMKGAIGVRGQPGGGSVFWFTADVCSQDVSQSRFESGPAAIAERSTGVEVEQADFERGSREVQRAESTGPERVIPHPLLVVEDNPVNQRMIQLQLRKLGYDAEIVGDGQQALAALRAKRYSLVLMDQQMPIMDGLATTAAIREEQAAGSSLIQPELPIIALTANSTVQDRERCLASGMDDFLSKPLQLTELSMALFRHLQLEESAVER